MKCPICEKPTQWQDNPNRPFCSERCRMIDFGHWVDEDYTVPLTTYDQPTTTVPDAETEEAV